MQITLMRNKSENNCIGKTLNTVDIVLANLKTTVSMDDIELELDLSEIGKVKRVNYVYIDELERYYFVTDKYIDTGMRYILKCHIDVLETFKESILAIQCVVDKTEDAGKADLFIDDGSFVTENRYVNQVLNFPNGFTNAGEFILITVG